MTATQHFNFSQLFQLRFSYALFSKLMALEFVRFQIQLPTRTLPDSLICKHLQILIHKWCMNLGGLTIGRCHLIGGRIGEEVELLRLLLHWFQPLGLPGFQLPEVG